MTVPEFDLTIVIPTHRPARWAGAVLDGLHQHSTIAERIEVVLVLDGPDAGRAEALAERTDPFDVRVVASPGRGRAAACNAGGALARGRVLLFLDDDMLLDAGAVSAHLLRHRAPGEVAVVGAAPVLLRAADGYASRYVARRFARHLVKLSAQDHRLTVRDVYTGAFSVGRGTFLDLGGFDTRFVEYGNEDGDLAGRLMAAGVEIVFAAEARALQTYDKSFAELAADTVAKGRTAALFLALHPGRAAESPLSSPPASSLRRRAVRGAGRRLGRSPLRVHLVWATETVACGIERISPAWADRVTAVVLDGLFWAGAGSPTTEVRHREVRTLVHYTDGAVLGGVERVALTVLANVPRDRWRPVLVVHDDDRLEPVVREALAHGIDVVRLPALRGALGVPALPAAVRTLRRLRPSVVHVHRSWAASGTTGILAAALVRHRALVTTEHLHLPTTPRRALLLRRATDRLVHRHVAVSAALAQILRDVHSIPAARIRIVLNGVEPPAPVTLAAHASASTRGTATVLVPARLDRQKGHATLLEALTGMPHVTVLLAGEGPARRCLEDEARSQGVADRVHFLGHRDDVRTLMAQADVVVLPSVAEGLPLVLLEAMAAGRPIVATAVGGVPEIVEDRVTGLLVPPGDAPALAAAVLSVLADPRAARELGERGRQRWRDRYDAVRMVEEYCAIYEELLQ